MQREPYPALMIKLSTAQKNIIEALGQDTLKTDELAANAVYEISGNFREAVTSLRKQGILGNNRPGYYVMPDYKWLLRPTAD